MLSGEADAKENLKNNKVQPHVQFMVSTQDTVTYISKQHDSPAAKTHRTANKTKELIRLYIKF